MDQLHLWSAVQMCNTSQRKQEKCYLTGKKRNENLVCLETLAFGWNFNSF